MFTSKKFKVRGLYNIGMQPSNVVTSRVKLKFHERSSNLPYYQRGQPHIIVESLQAGAGTSLLLNVKRPGASTCDFLHVVNTEVSLINLYSLMYQVFYKNLVIKTCNHYKIFQNKLLLLVPTIEDASLLFFLDQLAEVQTSLFVCINFSRCQHL